MTATSFSAPAPVARRDARLLCSRESRYADSGSYSILRNQAHSISTRRRLPGSTWVGFKTSRASPRARAAPILTGIPAASLEQTRESLEAQAELRVSRMDKADDGARDGIAAHEPSGPGDWRNGRSGWRESCPRCNHPERLDRVRHSIDAADAANFAPGSMIAVDADYAGQTGYLGLPSPALTCASRLPTWITFGASPSMSRLCSA